MKHGVGSCEFQGFPGQFRCPVSGLSFGSGPGSVSDQRRVSFGSETGQFRIRTRPVSAQAQDSFGSPISVLEAMGRSRRTSAALLLSQRSASAGSLRLPRLKVLALRLFKAYCRVAASTGIPRQTTFWSCCEPQRLLHDRQVSVLPLAGYRCKAALLVQLAISSMHTRDANRCKPQTNNIVASFNC